MTKSTSRILFCITILWSITVFKVGDIYAAEVLTGDPRLACEAILCLSDTGNPPSECTPALERYFGIKKRKWKDTLKARKRFLDICPKMSEDEELERIIAEHKEEKADENASTPSGPQGEIKEGILWKPVSEKNGHLVVLLGSDFGNPDVSILDANMNLIEKGDYYGKSNGRRATYRFNRPGGGYPNPCYLKVGEETYLIENPSQRHE